MIKGKRLSKMTKRLMTMFRFYSFKEKLRWKCDTYNKKLIIVDESYTSCTCGECGYVNKRNGEEWFKCIRCKMEVDRDVNGSRNILIKNLRLG